MNKHQIDEFEKTEAQLEALHQELVSLSKKDPNGASNEFKLRLINLLIGYNRIVRQLRCFPTHTSSGRLPEIH